MFILRIRLRLTLTKSDVDRELVVGLLDYITLDWNYGPDVHKVDATYDFAR